MRQDRPTSPMSDWRAPDSEPGAPTVEEPRFGQSGTAPFWPDARERRAPQTEPGHAPRGYVSATLFGMSVGVNAALLIGLVAVVLMSYAGAFPPGASARLAPGTGPGLATGSPTVTLTPALSPTAGAGWLQVSPASAQLGCGGGQDTQTVVLRNTGSRRVSWQAQIPGTGDHPGVSVNPHDGRLSAGDSVEIQIQNTSQSSDHQGVIQFTSSSQSAGAPASVSYTTTACQ